MSMTAVHLNHHHAGLGFIGIVISAHVGAMYILVPVFGVLTDRLSAVATITMRHGAHSPCLRDRRGSAARSEHGAGGDHAAGHWLVRHPRGILGSARRRVAHQFSRQLPRPFRLGHEHLWRCRRTAGWAHRQCDGPRVPRGSSRNRYCYPGHAHAAARFPFEQESGRVGRRVVSRGVSGVTPRP